MKWCYRFLLPVLVLLSVEAKSQVYTYHSFPDSNMVWNVWSLCHVPGSTWAETWSYNTSGDTIIGGARYFKLYETSGSFGPCLIREALNKRVYRFSFMDTILHESLLYDFSLSSGDTLLLDTLNPIIVNSVDTPIYLGIARRTLHVFHHNVHDVWIEGIGSVWGPLGIWMPTSSFCGSTNLCQVIQNSMYVFQSNAPPCMVYYSISETPHTANVNTFPNPCTITFTIQLTTPPSAETYFQLYDALGRQVKREEVISTTTTIHRNNLPSGIYFWQLTARNKILERGKVVME